MRMKWKDEEGEEPEEDQFAPDIKELKKVKSYGNTAPSNSL